LAALRTRVHRQAHVGLSERGGVVGAIAHHRYEFAFRLLRPQVFELRFRRRLGDEVINSGLMGDRLRSQWVVAGDHHRAETHQPRKKRGAWYFPSISQAK
jgi:hypothetical protein